MSPEFLEIVGVGGFALYVITYGALTLKCLDADDTPYFVLNGAAASMVLIGLLGSFNLASALIQMFWIAISVVAIAMRIRRRTRPVSTNADLPASPREKPLFV